MKSELNKDISVGMMFVAGILAFMAGEFIVSTVVFALAAISSNIDFNSELND